MSYTNGICAGFGGIGREKKGCHNGNDIGRACNMSHAEQVAGRKYGHGTFFFLGWSSQRSSLSVFFLTNGWELAKKARAVQRERKCGQACDEPRSSWGKSGKRRW